jgi:hypothetical protein
LTKVIHLNECVALSHEVIIFLKPLNGVMIFHKYKKPLGGIEKALIYPLRKKPVKQQE